MQLKTTWFKRFTDTEFAVGILLIAFLTIGYFAPLGGDDWYWHSPIGTGLLRKGFAGYNGRYLGNIIEILATHSIVFKTLMYGISSTMLTVMIAMCVSKGKLRAWFVLLTGGLLLTISTEVYSQTFGWIAGYVNYVVGMLPILFFIQWYKNRTHSDATVLKKAVMTVLLFVVGFSASLFVEHITLYSVLLGLFFAVQSFFKFKEKLYGSLSYAVGTISGAAVMFSNSAYHQIATGEYKQEAARGIHANAGLIDRIINVYVGGMYKYLFQKNGLLIFALACFLIVAVHRKQSGSQLFKVFKFSVSIVIMGYAVFAGFLQSLFPASNFNWAVISPMLAMVSLVFVVAVIFAIFFIENDNVKRASLFDVVSAVILTAPFAVITPYGPRCAFASIVFMIMFVLELCAYLFEDNTNDRSIKSIAAVFGTVSLIFVLMVTVINGKANNARSEYINTHASSKVIYIKRLPFEQYTWRTTPARPLQFAMFNDYYGIGKGVEVKFVPFKTNIK